MMTERGEVGVVGERCGKEMDVVGERCGKEGGVVGERCCARKCIFSSTTLFS